MKLLAICALFALAVPASAQTVEVGAGVGTLVGDSAAGGAGVTLYNLSPNGNGTQTNFGASFYNHHLVLGGYEKVFRGDTTYSFGAQEIVYSFDGVSLVTGCVCAQVTRKRKDGLTISSVVGFMGQPSFLPWMQTADPKHFGVGLFLQDRVGHHWTLFSLNAETGGVYTSAHGVGYDAVGFHFNASAGLASGAKYVDANFIKVWQYGSFGASHNSYFSPYTLSFDNVGIGARYSHFSMQAGVNHSTSSLYKSVLGESVGLGVNTWRLSIQSTVYQSSGSKRVFLNTLGEQITSRISLSQGVTIQDGHQSLTFGGAYRYRRFSIGLNHNLAFVAQGYVQVTSVQFSFRIGDMAVNAMNVTDPYGKNRWLVGTDSYMHNSMPWLAHDAPIATGKYIVSGVCTDGEDRPVAGCAITIGKSVAYSDMKGEFSLRVKKNSAVPIVVDVVQFITMGDFNIVSAPETATPGQAVKVVVKAVVMTVNQRVEASHK
jgi:hypothetical protein